MRIIFHKDFKKKFSKLDPKIKKSFKKKLHLFTGNPYAIELQNHALKGKFEGYRSINITGDYRAIFWKRSEEVVEIVRIGTHSELYW